MALSLPGISAATSQFPDEAFRTGAWGTSGPGSLGQPTFLAIGPTGDLYISDTGKDRVDEFTSTGGFVGTWGTPGTGNGQFDFPQGVAFGNGEVYVADFGNDRVERFSPAGVYKGTFGSTGSGPGQFLGPDGVAVGPTGTVYVVDQGNDRVEMFGPAGAYLGSFGADGSAPGQFFMPTDVAVSAGGQVFVVDSGNDRVEAFSSTGVFGIQWGSLGSAPGDFYYPNGISIGVGGTVLVSDTSNRRVEAFTATGKLLAVWVTGGAGYGTGGYPADAVTEQGYLLATDPSSSQVVRYSFHPHVMPDLTAVNPMTGTSVGDGSVSAAGVETLGHKVARGASFTFVLRLENDGALAHLRLSGSGGRTGFAVAYIVGSTNVTQKVEQSSYVTPMIANDATSTVKLRVTVGANVASGASFAVRACETVASTTTPRDCFSLVTTVK